jgi:hypothetical protein
MRAKLRAVSLEDGPPLCDVAPLGGRLVLFYADYRVPHEVLPAYRARSAVTVWYFDAAERARAAATDHAADDAESLEVAAIERLEARFGGAERRPARALNDGDG